MTDCGHIIGQILFAAAAIAQLVFEMAPGVVSTAMERCPIWIADLAGLKIERRDVTPDLDCAALTQQVRNTTSERAHFVLYHFGLASVIPPDSSQSIAEYGMRAGDVLFLVPPTWPIGVCRWLAEDVLDTALTKPGAAEAVARQCADGS